MSKLKYITIDRIFSRLNRDLKGTELNESDVIEWIGEALEFLEVPQILEEDVRFLQVKDYHADMPDNLHLLTQIARNTTYSENIETLEKCPTEIVVPDSAGETDYDGTLGDAPVEETLDADCTLDCETLNQLDLDWTYTIWTSSEYYLRNYTPVRLATGTFFNSLVCKEKDESLYATCEDEYTIIGTTEKKLRFNFIEGQVAVAYLKNSVDKETGYPLIPDNISYVTAITYYIKWKIAEMYEWSGREGWAGKAEKAEAKWLKYVRQAKNYMKMPKTLDEFQNLLEQTHYLIPDHKKYYGFFGNLGKNKTRNFNTFNKTRTRIRY